MPKEQKTLQYTVALNQLKHYMDTLWFDYPLVYQRKIKDAIKVLEEKIQQ